VTGDGAPKLFPWWLYVLSGLVVAVLIVWPISALIFASSIADAYGCALDGSAPCLVDGDDWTSLLMTVKGWSWTILPIGLLALLIWGAVLFRHRRAFGQGVLTTP
jgi:hypothetical protein